MNREIKFRAWDTKDDTMWEAWNPYISQFQAMEIADKLCAWRFIKWEEEHQYIFMQYVWIKDKNWKEWYLWDIVKFYFDVYKDSLKIWMEEKIWVISENKYFHSCVISDWKEYHIDRLMSWEKIWNRFENPDLLSNK